MVIMLTQGCSDVGNLPVARKKRDCGRATTKFTVFAETDLNCYMSTHTNDETV